jgi:hypothetical protein
MSLAELRAVIDGCKPSDQRFLLAYLRSKAPDYRRKLNSGDQLIDSGRKVRLRATRRGLTRVPAFS